jgi:hypothetical protein
VTLYDYAARCSDGSPSAWVVSDAGPSAPVLLYLPGGGYCDDLDVPCSSRSPDRLGSATLDGVPSEGLLTLMDGWTVIVPDYCSGDLWTGEQLQPVATSAGALHFSGRLILELIIERYGYEPDAVVGVSAGCFGALANADLWPSATIIGDGCYLPDGVIDPAWSAWTFALWGSDPDLYASSYPDAYLISSPADPVILAGLGLDADEAWTNAVMAGADLIHGGGHKYLTTRACVDSGDCARIVEMMEGE